jgi:hypothetical protein
MGTRTLASEQAVAMVVANPGLTPRQIGEALGFDHSNGLLSYLLKTKQVFASGPRGWHRLYATKELADLNHERIAAEAVETVRARKKRGWDAQEIKRKALRAAAQAAKPPKPPKVAKPQPQAPAASTPPIILPTTKITVAPTPRPRFAVEPGFVGVISGDWMQRRQGATSEST